MWRRAAPVERNTNSSLEYSQSVAVERTVPRSADSDVINVTLQVNEYTARVVSIRLIVA